MIDFQRILFPTDFSGCAEQALKYALFLAKRYGSEIHMLHAVVLHEYDPQDRDPEAGFPSIEFIHKAMNQIAGQRMDATVAAHGTENVRIVRVHERGIAAADGILKYARDVKSDLIVMGTHGRRGLAHLLLGSVAEEVVRHAPCPVLTIREHHEPGNGFTRFDRILVPVDFSEFSATAVSYAIHLAKQFKGRIDLLHVVEEHIHPMFYVEGQYSPLDLFPDVVAKSGEEMARLMEAQGGGKIDFVTHVVSGRPPSEIIKFAEKTKPDILVIGTRGLTEFEGFLIGSTTEKVVRHVDTPVLTIKSI